jgi:hypothetical protein
LLTPFPKEANLKGVLQLKGIGRQGDNFLGSSPCVEHEEKEGVISVAFWSRAIYCLENSLHLFPFQILHGSCFHPFERDGKDALAMIEYQRFMETEVAAKAADGGQSIIPGLDSVSSFFLQMIQEGHYKGGREICESEPTDRLSFTSCNKIKEKLDRIPVAEDRMAAEASLKGEIIL